MTQAEIKLMIEAVGVPSAYYQFAENTGIEPPFICYFLDESRDLYADNVNFTRIERLYIELYTNTKDFELERRLGDVLNANELTFTKEDTFLDSERMHETIFTTDVVLEVQNV